MAKLYAQAVGVTVVLLGVLGLVLGDRLLFDAVNIDLFEDIVHLVSGGALAYVGFARVDERTASGVVGAVGAVYLLYGILGFFTENLFGLLPSGLTVVDNILHLAIGALGLMAAAASRRPATTA